MPLLGTALTFPDATSQATAGMIGTNNLGEVTNANTARENLGLTTGTSFPAFFSAGTRCIRTDKDYTEFVYDGTRWISVQPVILPFAFYPSGGGIADLASGTYEQWIVALPSHMAFRAYRAIIEGFNFGTNNGSNYWKFTIRTFPGLTNLQTTPMNTSAWSAGTWTREEATTFNSQPTTSDHGLQVLVSNQGTPGSIRLSTITLIGRWTTT